MEISENPEKKQSFINDWTLDPKMCKTSIFIKKKCFEKMEYKKLCGFIKSGLFKDVSNPMLLKLSKFSCVFNQVEEMKKNIKKDENLCFVSHKLAKHHWGRITPVNYLSLGVFHRQVRHNIAKDHYVDLDMENAQPCVVYNIAKQNNYDMDNLEKYVKNKDKFRKKIMEHHNVSKDTSKRLFISLLFGGSYNKWIIDNDIQKNNSNFHPYATEIEKEMKAIINIVYSTNKTILKDVKKAYPDKWKTESEEKRGVMGLWSQTCEKIIQESCISKICNRYDIDIESIVPCQDGFMILKKDFKDEMIQCMDNHISETFDFDIKWAVKPFDEGIEWDNYDEIQKYEELEDSLSSKVLSDYFIETYGHNFVLNENDVYVFYEGRWYDESDKGKRHKFLRYISENLYNDKKKYLDNLIELEEKESNSLKKILRNMTCKNQNISDIMKHTLSRMKPSSEPFNNKPFLLGFENGVLDLRNKKFRQYKYDDYITMTTGYDYKPVKKDDKYYLIQKELEKIFTDIQPDESMRNFLFEILCSSLDGRLYQKLFLLNGQGGNGKGLCASLMKKILGDYYVQPSNGILKDIETSNRPSPDMFNLRNKRYINFTEVGGLIRVSMLRNLTGGGTFSARKLKENPVSFKLTATVSMEFNNPPELDGQPKRADYRRLVDYEYPTNFTDDPSLIGKTINGISFKQANSYYETDTFIENVYMVFLDNLLDIYQKNYNKDEGIRFNIPKNIRDRTEKFIENQNKFQKIFKSLFVIDDKNKNETTKLSQVWNEIKNSDEYRVLSFADKRIYGRDAFYQWTSENYKVEYDKNKNKIIKGIKIKYNEYDIDIDSEEESVPIATPINPLDVL